MFFSKWRNTNYSSGVVVNVVTIAAVIIGNDRRAIEVLVEFDNRNCGSSSSSSDKCCNTQ